MDSRARSSHLCIGIDEDGVIQWSYGSPVGVNPGADGILQALEAMRTSRTAEVV